MGNKINYSFLVILLLSLLNFTSCSKDDENPLDDENPTPQEQNENSLTTKTYERSVKEHFNIYNISNVNGVGYKYVGIGLVHDGTDLMNNCFISLKASTHGCNVAEVGLVNDFSEMEIPKTGWENNQSARISVKEKNGFIIEIYEGNDKFVYIRAIICPFIKNASGKVIDVKIKYTIQKI